ncbi:MAG: hypothetical protein IPP91_11370 [Betaproteobacteria bacterium]|nr:hypothetical protein [Betaproteobacteria bacterium]
MDYIVHMAASATIVLGCILHMNAMTPRSPKIEMALWWMLGVGACAELLWIDFEPGWPDTMSTIAMAGLVVLYTQPQWRPWLAERRGGSLLESGGHMERRQQ